MCGEFPVQYIDTCRWTIQYTCARRQLFTLDGMVKEEFTYSYNTEQYIWKVQYSKKVKLYGKSK